MKRPRSAHNNNLISNLLFIDDFPNHYKVYCFVFFKCVELKVWLYCCREWKFLLSRVY